MSRPQGKDFVRATQHSREALDALFRLYWKPIYFYVRRRGASVEDAKELTQGFFAELLRRDSLRLVEKDKGKFRTFLLTFLERFLINPTSSVEAVKKIVLSDFLRSPHAIAQ
ncbi:MAG: sigma-70 family RNA polymerase sigma factor [Planctomycetes bacterium]|nr:sigma-70 family RNA polymerase sigma factor [Planctomycetota bacterium]